MLEMYNNLNKVPTEMAIKFWRITFFYSAAKLLSVHGRNLHVTSKEKNNYHQTGKWKNQANSLLLDM